MKDNLSLVPVKSDRVSWSCTESGRVTLKVRHKDMYSIICQKLFSTPKVSRIGLDDIGSCVWLLMDGRRTVEEIGREVEHSMGSDAYPIYERLTGYIKILRENKIVRLI